MSLLRVPLEDYAGSLRHRSVWLGLPNTQLSGEAPSLAPTSSVPTGCWATLPFLLQAPQCLGWEESLATRTRTLSHLLHKDHKGQRRFAYVTGNFPASGPREYQSARLEASFTVGQDRRPDNPR